MDTTTILDPGSAINLINYQLAEDWNLPLIPNATTVVFPNKKEYDLATTQELMVTFKLRDHKGKMVEKKQALRFSISKNIPYGCLIGIHSLFNLKIGFKLTKSGYTPFFDEEEISEEPLALSLEDLNKEQVSFVNLEEEKPLDFSMLPKEYMEFAGVFLQSKEHPLPPHRSGLDCGIDLVPGAKLHRGPVYPMNPLQVVEADKYIDENLEKGFIRPSKSPVAYPVLFQLKKDGSLRFCVDYRKLNAVTVRDSYPLPRYNLFFEQVKGSKYFTKLDLKAAYNLIRIREGDEYKTSFRTRRGQFEYLVMPFGLTNAPAVFQRFIDHILSEFIYKFVVVYLDDILIYSKSLDEHRTHVAQVLKVLQENYLVVKLEKCIFHVPEIEFLGHIVSGTYVKTDPKKIKAVKEWPEPKSVKEVQSFLGLCNYYRRFIKNFSLIASPLFQLIRKNSKFFWSQEKSQAFTTLKEKLTTAPVLILPDPNKQFILETDASRYALGCVLSQRDDQQKLHPVSYYSRSFSRAERNYSITDKELLAIIAGLEEWRHLLIGTKEPILIYTDHRNLLFASKPQKLSMRQARWQEILSYYNYHVFYRPGSVNVRADSLSRRPDLIPEEDSPLESIIDPNRCSFFCFLDLANFNPLLEAIRQGQKVDVLYNRIITALEGNNDAKRKVKYIDINKFKIKKGLLLFNNLICVPLALRHQVLSSHHDYAAAGHLGIQRTAELVSRNFYWPGWEKDIRNFVKSCKICATMKASKHKTYGKLIPLRIPDCPWQVVEIDFITNIYSSKFDSEFSIMVSCDRLTKMVHLFAFPGLPSANEAAIAFLKSVFYLHGLPNEIITDRGSQFTSKLWEQILTLLSIKHTTATTAHHTTVGQVERLNQSIEQFIRCFLRAYSTEDWLDWLYLIEFIYNNSKNSSTGQPPFLAFNGFLPNFSPVSVSVSSTIGKVYHIPDFNSNISKIKHILAASQELYKNYGDKRRMIAPKLTTGELVWLKRPSNFIPKGSVKLCPRKYGPFKIIEVLDFNNYRLDLANSPFPRRYNVFNICELEPFTKRNHEISGIRHSPEIHSIVNCRINPSNGKCEYLVSFIEPGFPDKWIDSSIIDEDDYYSNILATFNNKSNNTPV